MKNNKKSINVLIVLMLGFFLIGCVNTDELESRIEGLEDSNISLEDEVARLEAVIEEQTSYLIEDDESNEDDEDDDTNIIAPSTNGISPGISTTNDWYEFLRDYDAWMDIYLQNLDDFIMVAERSGWSARVLEIQDTLDGSDLITFTTEAMSIGLRPFE